MLILIYIVIILHRGSWAVLSRRQAGDDAHTTLISAEQAYTMTRPERGTYKRTHTWVEDTLVELVVNCHEEGKLPGHFGTVSGKKCRMPLGDPVKETSKAGTWVGKMIKLAKDNVVNSPTSKNDCILVYAKSETQMVFKIGKGDKVIDPETNQPKDKQGKPRIHRVLFSLLHGVEAFESHGSLDVLRHKCGHGHASKNSTLNKAKRKANEGESSKRGSSKRTKVCEGDELEGDDEPDDSKARAKQREAPRDEALEHVALEDGSKAALDCLICINPWHLLRGTQAQNRSDEGCRNGALCLCPHQPPCIFNSRKTGKPYPCLNHPNYVPACACEEKCFPRHQIL